MAVENCLYVGEREGHRHFALMDGNGDSVGFVYNRCAEKLKSGGLLVRECFGCSVRKRLAAVEFESCVLRNRLAELGMADMAAALMEAVDSFGRYALDVGGERDVLSPKASSASSASSTSPSAA